MSEQTLQVDPQFRALIPPLCPQELAGLEASLVAEGCRDALVVATWPGGEALADGHHPLRLCVRLDIP